MASRPRLVIAGGGFGGLATAKALRHSPIDVTIVDRRNHHLFQPLLYQVATAGLSPTDIAAPIRSIVSRARNTNVVLDEVVGIDSLTKRVSLARGAPLNYDFLLLATGARHSYFGHDDWAAHAPGMKSIEDATAVRRKLLLAFERAETETDQGRRKVLLTFVVIGGGPTGIEMAGAIAELAHRSVSRDFRNITPRCSRVILIEGGERLLPAFPESLSVRASEAVTRLGVELILGRQVTHVAADHVCLGDERIPSHTIIWAAGVEASPAARWLGVSGDRAGRIFVGHDLRVPCHPGVFAIGDTANCLGLDGRQMPGTAPVAKQQGKQVAATILAELAGCPAPRFYYRHFGSFATIGRSHAVIDFGRVKLWGLPAWLLWSMLHIFFLIGFRNRLSVSLNWLWNYMTFQRSARLITGDIVPQPHLATPLEAAA